MLSLNKKENPLAPSIERILAKLQDTEIKSRVVDRANKNRKAPRRKKKKVVGARAFRIMAARFRMYKKNRVERRKSPIFLKERKRIIRESATIYIESTHNNTIYTICNNDGETRNWVSPGKCGFKNTRKSTSYAAQGAAEKVVALAKSYNITNVILKIRGLGPGKFSGVRALHQSGLRINRIWERTTLPHNGCRPPKPRRI